MQMQLNINSHDGPLGSYTDVLLELSGPFFRVTEFGSVGLGVGK
jgi:hypothetical protein